MLPNTKAGLLMAVMAGLTSMSAPAMSGNKSKNVIRSEPSKEEQQRRIEAAQEKRERKNAARLYRSNAGHK